MPSLEEIRSRQVAEEAREKKWKKHSFLRDLFLGDFRLEHIHPFPVEEDRPAFLAFYNKLKQFLEEKVDPVAIDASGEYPPDVVRGLAELGAFGMKIPEKYGGLGLSHPEYVRVMELLGSYDANITALLSAHQAIGVPQPVRLFGTEEQKRRFLPRCARGAISAFALTERAVGSDPARLSTVAELTPDGTRYILNGEKLWCTNGTLAELLVVMARNPRTDRINAFVVETNSPGVRVVHRCRFMGLRALANAVVSFENVEVPADNLIGGEGAGLRVALTTLNTGRLSLPAATAGLAKLCVEIQRKWAGARMQWGVPIGRHEAVAITLGDTAATTFAMDSVAQLVGHLADRPGYDIRLEAAAAKEWNTTRAWKIIDDTLQVRGGRGYETERSLAERGEPAIGVERALRDTRINRIFEGSSEIMHLFMAREALDRHLRVAGALVDPHAGWRDRLRALPAIVFFYAWWYPTRWLGLSLWPRFRAFGRLGRHLRFAARMTRRLARTIFHAMVVHRARLERKQGFLFRAVDVAMELFAVTASASRASQMAAGGHPDAASALALADLFGRGAKRRVRKLLRDMWRNDDNARHQLGRELMEGRHLWLENGSMGLPYSEEELVPPTVSDILLARDAERRLREDLAQREREQDRQPQVTEASSIESAMARLGRDRSGRSIHRG